MREELIMSSAGIKSVRDVLATMREQELRAEEASVNELPYVAPEVLMGAAPNAAADVFTIGVLVEMGRAVNIVAGGALKSAGDAKFSAVVGGSLMWLLGVPSAYLLGGALGLGLTGVWLSMALDEIVRGVVNYRRWKAGHWRTTSQIMPARLPTLASD